MAWFETWIKNDLAKPINVVQLQGVLFNLDNLANKIGVELEYNGQPAALEGTIAGYVIRNDGTTLNLTANTGNTGKDGNKAWVILPQEAYTVEGPISIVIKVVYNSAETTIGACAGYVTRSRTSSEIAPTGTVIPSLASLEAAIAAANAAAANAADAVDYIAPSEEESTASAPYAAGSYFIYDGKLMKATSAIAQGATIVPYAPGVTNYNCAEVPKGLSGDVYNVNNTANTAANNAADAQRLVAPVESMAGAPASVATMPHATGSNFVFGGVLYKATADIAIGDNIVTTGTGANAAQVPGGAMGEVAELKSAITKITGNSLIAYASKKYINLSGDTVTMSGGEPQFTGNDNEHNCAVVSCSADDVFTIGGKGGNNTRLWAFVDSIGNILIKANANASATGLVITAPTSAAWLILHNEVSDIRDSYVGYQVEMNNKNNNNNVKRLEDNTITSFSLTGVSTSIMLYKHSFKSGEKIYVRCTGNKCNLLGRKKSDYTATTLINNFLPSETYTEYTFTDDIEYLGLYLYDTTKTTTVYIFSGEGHALYGKVYDKIAEEKDTLNAQKVNGVIVWDEETEVTETDGKLVYGALNSTISEFTYATGHYIKCAISNNSKVRVKGYGWDQSSNFALWAFTDSSNKIIARDTENAHAASQWLEVEVPRNAAYLYVNGNQAIHAAAQVAYYSTDFAECYNAVKDKASFKLITLGDSITKLGTSDRGWVKYFIEKTGATLVANVAVDGAQLVDKEGTTYDGTPTDSNPTNNVLGNQVQKIINNNYDAPDLIMIAVGTNNGIFITAEQIKAAYYDANNDLVPLADVNRRTGAGAYRYCTETLHNLYPNAVIVWCAPIYSAQASRRMDQIEAWGESLEIATRYSGQMFIDTFRCGINGVGETVGSNGEYLYDGLHPNANGAKHIGRYNASKIMSFIGNLINAE